jgi:hypothetical protein
MAENKYGGGAATELVNSPEYQEVSAAIQARTNPTGGGTVIVSMADFAGFTDAGS